MITTINEYTRNPQYLKSLFKKICRGLYNITNIKLDYKFGTDNNTNNIKYSDVLSNNYTYLNFEVGDIPEKYKKIVQKYLNDFKKYLEEKNIVMSYYESWYDAGYDIITMRHSGKKDIRGYFKIYMKDAMGKRIKPPKYVYHSSSIKNREKIQSEGIKVSYPKNWKQEGKQIDYMPSIFAVKSNKNIWHGQGDVWQIDTTKIDNKWWEDLNLYKNTNWGNNAIMTFEDIPPEAIEHIYF